MIDINEITDSLIKGAKQDLQGENVRFLKAYNKTLAENPIEQYIAVVNIEEVSSSREFVGGYFDNTVKSDKYHVKLCIRLYCGSDIKGEDLGAMTLKVAKAVNDADESKIIDSYLIGPITYDSELESIYREISFSLEFYICGEE